MKIKKKTGLAMLATAAVAATGVAAVSFAAWSNANATYTLTAATGSAYLVGFTSDQSTANADLGTLIPYDQPDNSYDTSSGYVKYSSIQLPEYSVNSDYKITVTTNSTSTAMKFYVKVDAQVAAAPENLTGWTEVTSSGAVFNFNGITTNTTVNDKYLSVVMASTDTTAMNQTDIGFTVTLAANPATPSA